MPGQIERQTVIGGIRVKVFASVPRLIEQPQCAHRVEPVHGHQRLPGQHCPIGGRNSLRAFKKAFRRIGIVQGQRSAPGIEQRGQRSGTARQPPHGIVKRCRSRIGQLLHHFLRSQRDRDGGKRDGQARQRCR